MKEVTSELIMMHESFLRTKTAKFIMHINNIYFYIGHSKITTPPHKTPFNQIRNGEKEIRQVRSNLDQINKLNIVIPNHFEVFINQYHKNFVTIALIPFYGRTS